MHLFPNKGVGLAMIITSGRVETDHLFSAPAKPAHPTAWLDGLRGIAAFFVFIYHYQHEYHKAYNWGYGGANGEKAGVEDHRLIQLPIIRLIFTGGPMVSIFWVLSGVSLSLKPIQLARSQSWDKFFDTMFSSVFRRMLRLYIPVFAVQSCVLLATLLGFYNHAHDLAKEWPFYGTNEKQFEVYDSNLGQIADWLATMWKFANPFAPHRPKYDVHLWTIPLEFRNSIILFATLVGYAKLRPRIRIVMTTLLYFYLALIEQGDVGLFIAGMGCAEFLIILDENAKRLPSFEHATDGKQSKRSQLLWTGLFVVGLWLLSWPAWGGERTPGYATIQALTPSFIKSCEMTYSRLGAALALLGLCGAAFLRTPFETPLAIYLGKISFPLYIVHGPVNHVIGEAIVPFFWRITGNESLFAYETGVVLAFAVCAAIVVCLADLVMRVVDQPSVRFGRTLQNKWSM
ncbi:acyltransferase 3 [Lophiotrema nucula]|uniref:Acyltransferase 3 n=1 Tax=Lophiotrema nucula TaxID=690887 RepID=A0A6A5Z4L2_9PLEO|nr:acyltransferase 3 [Lophiotrema nucula]